ncbi:MAG: chemotaxis protein CheD [Nitrospirae bacterium]|nr:chemotaxis protein CheD [Nitrospirota bacterium]
MSTMEARLPLVYLNPGEMHLSKKPGLVATVLGSCVSVTMFNQRLGTGAICHIVLPKCKCKANCDNDCTKRIHDPENGCRRNCSNAFRYADCSIFKMMETFRSLGIDNDEIEVKLFGGSDMFPSDGGKSTAMNVGKQNIESALQGIELEGLKLTACDVGGSGGRKILFYTHTGEVFLKRL